MVGWLMLQVQEYGDEVVVVVEEDEGEQQTSVISVLGFVSTCKMAFPVCKLTVGPWLIEQQSNTKNLCVTVAGLLHFDYHIDDSQVCCWFGDSE